jgi:RNA polymerase sigma-70 factor (subfamily 1)
MRMPGNENAILVRYRAYLETLSYIKIDPRLKRFLSFSDIVQETCLDALRELDFLESLKDDDRKRRLFRILMNNLKDQLKRIEADCRSPAREENLGGAWEQSSIRLEKALASNDPTPSQILVVEEQSERILEAVSQLPDRERQVLILHRYHHWKLSEIAEELHCTVGAVAGLHSRALKRLRRQLTHLEE